MQGYLTRACDGSHSRSPLGELLELAHRRSEPREDSDGPDLIVRSQRRRDRGRDWPDLVGRRDVPVGPRGQRGNEVGRGYRALTGRDDRSTAPARPGAWRTDERYGAPA